MPYQAEYFHPHFPHVHAFRDQLPEDIPVKLESMLIKVFFMLDREQALLWEMYTFIRAMLNATCSLVSVFLFLLNNHFCAFLFNREMYLRQKISNQSSVSEFLLIEFSNVRELQILHFSMFLLIYLTTLMGNLLIIITVVLDRHLHSPMYFFLGNLSIVDLSYISVTIPKSMVNALTNTRQISFSGCVAQVYLVITLADTELFLLTAMAYDRYAAICHPLHYRVIMNWSVCGEMAAGCWVGSMLYSVVHTMNTFRLSFCRSNVIGQFFCDVPQLLKISCSDTHANDILIFVLGYSLAFLCFSVIAISYVYIFSTVLKIPSAQGKYKAFSTCLPHLIIVCLFLGTGAFTYTRPKSASSVGRDLVAAILYSVVPPLINPIIYSLRNKELKEALRKLIRRLRFPATDPKEALETLNQCLEAV
ncbi:olfactory receptor 14A16-like [Eublepharis macularius]|uniref:Olfactory receptor 14A16-like n=1 Tax=Eublepharis macularius TaxID=481883 RepID=A0AA97K771_EUBMA|nr:olfactory receptor 14A16-like [Eublepharis macularius]